MWWEYALIGVAGAAAERAIVFLRALDRVPHGQRPWKVPHGPGGGMYLLSLALHLGIAAVAVGALAGAGLVTNSFVAMGGGVGAVQLVKQARALALHRDIPSRSEHPAPHDLSANQPLAETAALDRETDSHDMA